MYINIAVENWNTLAIKSDIIIYPVFRGVTILTNTRHFL